MAGAGRHTAEATGNAAQAATFRWSGRPGEPTGLSARTGRIKVGEVTARVRRGAAMVWEGTGRGRWAAKSSATITSSLGGATVTAEAGEGQLEHFPDTVQVLKQAVRTLTVTNGVAETSVDVGHYMWATEHGGVARAEAPVDAAAEISIVQLMNPSPTGDPVMAGQNEFVFGTRYFGPAQDQEYPSILFPASRK